METDEATALSSSLEEACVPLISETVWLKQNKYQEAEALYHMVMAGTVSKRRVKKRSSDDHVAKACVPLINETVWLKQNKYQEAEALYHMIMAGTVSKRRVKKRSSDNHVTKLSHPLLAETVWCKQNYYEDAEASYQKVCNGVNTAKPPDVGKSKKQNDKDMKKKLPMKKAGYISLAERLENRLMVIEVHCRILEGMHGGFGKAPETLQTVVHQLSSTVSDSNKELSEGEAHFEAIQNLLRSINNIAATIRHSMATGDKGKYKSYDVFYQSMSDRLLDLEEAMTSLSHDTNDLNIERCETSFQRISKHVNKVGLSKSVVSINALDNILKKSQRNENSPTKLPGSNKLHSSDYSVSIENQGDFSSLSGECSDFSCSDDIEEDFMAACSEEVKKNSLAQNPGQKVVPSANSTNPEKKSRRSRKKEALVYRQLQGNRSDANGSSEEKMLNKKSPPKTASINGEGNISKKKAGQASQKGNRNRKSTASRNHMSSYKSASSFSGLLPPVYSSFNSYSPYASGSGPFFNPAQQFGLPMFSPFPDFNQSNFASGLYASYNQPMSDFNPKSFDEQLDDMALQIQMHLANNQTLQLQQMLREAGRLRQLSMEKRHKKSAREEFHQRYQLLLNAFVQHQLIYLQQQKQESARLQSLQKKQASKAQSHCFTPKAKETSKAGKEKNGDDLASGISSLPGAVNPPQKASKKALLRKSYPCVSSQVNQVASFNPHVHGDRHKSGVSSIVVLDDLCCILIVDIINSCLKLYQYTLDSGPRKYNFKLGTTMNMPGPFYMAGISGNRVIVTRNNSLISIIKVTSQTLKAVNSLETRLQYYGVSFVENNTVAAAAYDANRIDLLIIDQHSSIQVKNLVTTCHGPELLATMPCSSDIVYLEKVAGKCMFLTCVDLNGKQLFSFALGGSFSDVWNVSCVQEKILCSNKQGNKLLLFSRSGKKRDYLQWPAGTINQPFAMSFSQCGDLFLANDGIWDLEENHYVTTEINVFSFINRYG